MTATAVTFRCRGFSEAGKLLLQDALASFIFSGTGQCLMDRVSAYAERVILELNPDVSCERILLNTTDKTPRITVPRSAFSADKKIAESLLPIIVGLCRLEEQGNCRAIIDDAATKGAFSIPLIALRRRHQVTAQKVQEALRQYLAEKEEREDAALVLSAQKFERELLASPCKRDIDWITDQLDLVEEEATVLEKLAAAKKQQPTNDDCTIL